MGIKQNPNVDPHISKRVGRLYKAITDLESGQVEPSRINAMASQLDKELDWQMAQVRKSFNAAAKIPGRAALAPMDNNIALPETLAKVRPHLEMLLKKAKPTLAQKQQIYVWHEMVQRAKELLSSLKAEMNSKYGLTNNRINRALAGFESSIERQMAA